ncbi:MAG: hypothetical protein LUC44_06110 [Prevotellaceae bacterium]|nr:hypothetical protein [Prevotellaceae bacterium]
MTETRTVSRPSLADAFRNVRLVVRANRREDSSGCLDFLTVKGDMNSDARTLALALLGMVSDVVRDCGYEGRERGRHDIGVRLYLSEPVTAAKAVFGGYSSISLLERFYAAARCMSACEAIVDYRGEGCSQTRSPLLSMEAGRDIVIPAEVVRHRRRIMEILEAEGGME